MSSVFLDKIVTSMHKPRQDGSTGFVSTTCFPDLSHTQILTEYCHQPTTALTPLGEMTKKFRVEAHRESRSVQRPMSELVRKPKFFRRAHNVFTNKVLLDLENSKRIKNSRRQQIWETGKADYGFEGIEDSFITQTDGEAGLGTASLYHEAGFNNVGVIRTGTQEITDKKLYGFHEAGPVTSTEAEDDYGDEGFDNFQYADDFNPEMVETVYPEDFNMDPAQSNESTLVPIQMNEDDAGMMRPGTSAAQQRADTASGGHRTASSSASVRFSSTPIPPPGVMVEAMGNRPGTSAGASAPREQQQYKAMELYEQMRSEDLSSPSAPLPNRPAKTSLTTATTSSSKTKNKKKTKKLAPARKRRAYNRSTFFELLLDTMEVPDPHAPRFGMLRTSPSRHGSRARSRSPIARAASQGTTASVTDQGGRYLPSNKPHTASAGLSTAFSSLSVAATETLTQTATGTSSAGGPVAYTEATLRSNQDDEASFEEDDPIANDPFDKWDLRSVERAMTGDKRERAKDYR